MAVSLDSVTFSPPTLAGYLWDGHHQVGKLQLSDHGTWPTTPTV